MLSYDQKYANSMNVSLSEHAHSALYFNGTSMRWLQANFSSVVMKRVQQVEYTMKIPVSKCYVYLTVPLAFQMTDSLLPARPQYFCFSKCRSFCVRFQKPAILDVYSFPCLNGWTA